MMCQEEGARNGGNVLEQLKTFNEIKEMVFTFAELALGMHERGF